MGSIDISLGSQGRSGRSGKVFKKGEGCCGIRQGTMLLSKKLYNGIYRYISGISGQIGLPSVFRSGNTHTYTRPQQIPDSKFRSTPPPF